MEERKSWSMLPNFWSQVCMLGGGRLSGATNEKKGRQEGAGTASRSLPLPVVRFLLGWFNGGVRISNQTLTT